MDTFSICCKTVLFLLTNRIKKKTCFRVILIALKLINTAVVRAAFYVE
jgi:hypothetical protein